MKALLLFPLAITLSLVGRQETTTVSIPIEPGKGGELADKLSEIRLEFMRCGGCFTAHGASLERCDLCGMHMIVVEAPAGAVPKVRQEDGDVRFGMEAREDELAVLYLSAVDSALEKAGAERIKADVFIRGPFNLHLPDSDAAAKAAGALTRVEGIKLVENTGRILQVKADGAAWAKVRAAVGEDVVLEVSWILSRGYGPIGFFRE